MKTKKTISLTGLIILASAVFMLSCENPVGLGAMLDLDGPMVTIESPAPRKAVSSQFTLEGSATDKSGVDEMVIKTERDTVGYAKQWRYRKGAWEVSENFGASWTALSGAEWNDGLGWSLPLDMDINGVLPPDGEYLFSVQATDVGGFSDDNSYKTIMLIIDNNAPSVTISNPYLYGGEHSRYIRWDSTESKFKPLPHFTSIATAAADELQGFHEVTHPSPEGDALRFDSANFGKFLTQDFKLQWEIDDKDQDVRSIDLRFYRYDKDIDEDESTLIGDDNYIYSYSMNLPSLPAVPEPITIKPNGSVIVPALHGDAYTGRKPTPDGGTDYLKNPVGENEKVTIQVVSICYDAAGHANEERILGYFIYWKQAGEPWITFTDGMEDPTSYYGQNLLDIQEDIFMIYPGREIKATALQAHGVGGVRYSVYKCIEEVTGSDTKLQPPDKDNPDHVIAENVEILNSRSSQIFPWSFPPPPMTGYYIVEAYAYGSKDGEIDYANASVLKTALFKVQDISFPRFDPIDPSASDPLFMHINNGKITISGTVTDATKVESIYMVWINPQSKNYATMSQLQYYRDQDYDGWKQAAALPNGTSASEDIDLDTVYDKTAPNKLWNLAFTEAGKTDTQRQIFAFSIEIDLASELGIGIASNLNALKSQMFLLRAENPDKKCHIITYAPQGDTVAPKITIEKVAINKVSGPNPPDFSPGDTSREVPQFQNGDVITIYGKWTEDSTNYLDFDTYLKPSFEFSLNGEELAHDPNRGVAIAYNPDSGTATEGTFTITITLGNRITIGTVRDTLMVNIKASDIGGNPSEDGASWLVQGSYLSFLRISSENADATYKAGDPIEIYLEFSKPVMLNPAASAPPVLLLSSTGTGATATASYKADQTVANTRQYFTYTVAAGHTATSPNYLNVTGLQGGDTGWNNANYRFMWQHILDDGTLEYVRLTTNTTNAANHARPLPAEGIQSLRSGKQISIDTAAPTISTTTATTGRHPQGAEVFITVTFNENVMIDTSDLPYLTLSNGNGNNGRTINANASDISVTRNIIRFRYIVQASDDTGANVLTVTGYGGTITDLAGNKFVQTISPARQLANVYLDTITPDHPQIQILDGSNAQINNTVSGATLSGSSNTTGGSIINMQNVYNDVVRIRVTAQGSYNTDYTKLEYSTNNGADWVPFNNVVSGTTAYTEPLSMNGDYTVTARQTDAAGNVSPLTTPIRLNWDKGTLISYIDSTTPNGTYSDKTSPNTINVTVYFRKPLRFTATQTKQITLNARRGTQANFNDRTVITINNDAAAGDQSALSFTYTIANNDNTPTGTGRTPYLDVTALALTATDAQNVSVNSYLTLPAANANNRLGERKDLIVTTGPLEPTTTGTNPAYNLTAADDQATGTINITFNRPISKGSGTITIAQNTANYRLPAVLTEAQSSRYRSAANFNTYYTRGTNGFIDGSGSDTTTKYVLNYEVDTIVTPTNGGTAIQQMAWDFRTAETVTLPISSQDVTITGTTGNILTITLTDSNALQVLGAAHTITIPQNAVRDSLGYTWPAAANQTTYTTPSINKSFIRVDKQINKDTVARTTGNGSNTNPWLTSTYVLQTTARLDCRTPNSVVQYRAAGTRYDAAGANGTATGTTSTGTPPNTEDNNSRPSQTGSRDYWMNNNTASNRIDTGSQQTPNTNYTNFTGTDAHLTVGDNAEHGYVWRITTRGRNSANGSTYSDLSEEIAFRTVLTVELTSMNATLGTRPDSGDNLWIRGGDAVSSSSVPGFPLTWEDDYNSLQREGKRAGIRLLRFISIANNSANLYTNTVWRWVSWEVNVETYYDVFLGRDVTTATAPDANKNWSYGPRLRAPQRGGWSIQKDYYKLYPGKHRWIRIFNSDFSPGGPMNFSSNFNPRPDL